MDKEKEKLKRLNDWMKERLIWFAENNFNADEAYRVHQQAIKDLEEYEKEIDEELNEGNEYNEYFEE